VIEERTGVLFRGNIEDQKGELKGKFLSKRKIRKRGLLEGGGRKEKDGKLALDQCPENNKGG